MAPKKQTTVTSPFAPDKETPEARLQRLGRAIYQNEQIIKSAKPGSPEFKKAQKALETLRKDFQKADAEVNAQRAAAKKEAANKALAKAQEELARAQALNDLKAIEKATEKVRKAQDTAASAGSAVVNKKDAATQDSDGDGIPDLTDNLPNYPNPDQKTGTGKTGTKTTASNNKQTVNDGTKTNDNKDTGDNKPDNKGLWVSYLRTVFAGLDDKEQKTQIDRLFDTAVKQNWDEKTFMEALKGTTWWQSNYASFRQFFLDSRDPRNAGTFAEKVTNQMDSIMATIEALGIAPRSVDPATGKVIDNTEFIKGIALEAIKNNWDTDQLENYLSTKAEFIFTGGGTIGSYYDRIKSNAYLYGVNIDANLQKAINSSLLDPLDGRDYNYWMNSVKQMAIDAPENKPFRESLMAGRTLYEVTSTYRNQMANLLEVDSTAITWDDLMSKVIDGNSGNARTFADFTKALKNDPLWQYTRNAKETYSNMALDLAQMFGYSG